MLKKLSLFFWFITLVIAGRGTTCTAVVSGDWEVAGTWSCGSVPTCGDTIVIPSSITVTITQMDIYYPPGCVGAMPIIIGGTLQFVTGKKLALPCGSSITLLPGGEINPGGGGGTSNLISICGNNVWIAGQGPLTGPLVLPVQMLYFTASYVSPSVNLLWATASEINNKEFTVQKSGDGTNWADVVTISGAGNSDKNLNYGTSDEEPLAGVSYYRLKQTDFDGQSSICATAAVNVPQTLLATVYPNPCPGIAVVQYKAGDTGPVNISLSDLAGRQISTYSFQPGAPGGLNNFNLDLTGLAAGIYLIKVETANASTILKVAKVNW